jgi:uncharacterized protein
MTVLQSVTQLPIDELLHLRLGVDRLDLTALCQRFRIVELGLFGSALRDDFRSAGDDPSDVDLLVTFEEGYRRSATEWLALEQAVEELFDRKVDLCQTRLLRNPYRRAEILQTAQVIYAA